MSASRSAPRRVEDPCDDAAVRHSLKRLFALLIALVLTASATAAQRTKPADNKELAGISERGRLLYEADQAVWHATDSVQALKPNADLVRGYVVEKSGSSWRVVFGRLTEDDSAYLVAYEATAKTANGAFSARPVDPVRVEKGRIVQRARALNTGRAAIGKPGRPYNIAVIDAPENRHWVYAFPAQTDDQVFPLGGDVRYLVSTDGASIIETRQLHQSILERRVPSKEITPTISWHTAVLDEVPEDTDVFHVLWRKFGVPELVATRTFMYQIETSGAIKYLGLTKDVLKN